MLVLVWHASQACEVGTWPAAGLPVACVPLWHVAHEPTATFWCAKVDGNHALVGSWVIEGKPAGIGMREDERRITHNSSRFVPHYFT